MCRVMLSPFLFLAAPSLSQTAGDTIVATPFDLAQAPTQTQLTRSEPIIAPQFVERFEPDGAKVWQRGIIVAKDIAPSVTVGLGFVDRKSRKSGVSPHLSDGPRGTGKASLLLKYRF